MNDSKKHSAPKAVKTSTSVSTGHRSFHPQCLPRSYPQTFQDGAPLAQRLLRINSPFQPVILCLITLLSFSLGRSGDPGFGAPGSGLLPPALSSGWVSLHPPLLTVCLPSLLVLPPNPPPFLASSVLRSVFTAICLERFLGAEIRCASHTLCLS